MVTPPTVVKDVFLNPGEFGFGGENYRFRTLLGSCVSIILWSPSRKIGGMCHYLLPARADGSKGTTLDGKYAEEAFQMYLQSLKFHKSEPSDFQAKIFGGSDMFSKEESILADVSNAGNSRQVGLRNIQFAKQKLSEIKIPIISENTGGSTHRRVFFSVWDGEVYMESNQK